MFGSKRDVYNFKDEKPPKKKREQKTSADEKSAEVKSQIKTVSEEPDYPAKENIAPQKQMPIEKERSNPKDKLKSYFYKKQDASDDDEDTENDADNYEVQAEPKKQKKPKKQRRPKPYGEKASFFKDKRKIGLTLIAVSLLVILIVSPMLNMMTSTEMTTAVVALQDIPKGTKLEGKMFSAADAAKSSLLPIHISDKNLVIDKYAKTDIAKDEILSTPKIADTLPFDNSYLYTLDDDKKALSIAIPSLSSGLSSKLQSGDIISVYANLNKDENNDEYIAVLPPGLAYIKVLAVTNADAFDLSSTPEKSALENPIANTLVLEVNNIQAMELVGLQANAQIHIALVTRGDEEKANFYLQMQEDYFTEEKVESQPKEESE